MEIKKLSKEELVSLRQEIDDRLKVVEIKEEKIKRGKILSLKNGDKIFGIRLSFNGHRLKEPNELNGVVDIIDYCNVKEMNLGDEAFFISVSHPTKPFGTSITLLKKHYENEHCFLLTDLMKTGYDGFFTLKPKTWKEDLIKTFHNRIVNHTMCFQKDLDLLNDKLKLFINSEAKINDHINF